ncbi:hypothetical protein J8TS2_31090 [Lederbergia ruris]|uniref:SH3b domain-containing protein n=1 Tax=Lederbergia ruris TaxID=217495 RepID=A0ABQ4KLG6_9BACI|nr:SH3 domain-containing protein [Lederbergia ruris]GIN58790.1 hypothetical protein J8TS2_31090 [Lederbergia ruris]
MQRKISLLSCILLMFSVLFAQGTFAYASDSLDTEDLGEDFSYYFIQYDGAEQEIDINENIKLILNGWTDESKSLASGKIEIYNETSNSTEEITLDVTDERSELVITEEERIVYRLAQSDSFKVEKVNPLELNAETTIITENENGTSIEEVKIIDEYNTVMNQRTVYYLIDEDSQKVEITEEEYEFLNAVEDPEIKDEPLNPVEDKETKDESSEVEMVEDEAKVTEEEEVNSIEEVPSEETSLEEALTTPEEQSEAVVKKNYMIQSNQTPSINYSTHVQTHGWLKTVKDGALSGTTGEAKRLEAIKISIGNMKDLGLKYSTHVQTYGWQDPVSAGTASGTTGKHKRLEAIKIELTGKKAKDYDVYYRVHSQTFGWLDWAKNGQPAGTEGLAKRLEAIQIKLVKKGGKAPGSTNKPFLTKPSVTYSTHVQSHGWMSSVKDGAMSGTKGESKRLEAIKIGLQDSPYSGGITYSSHVQGKGWINSVSNSSSSGTTGQGKRLEAIKINLTGKVAKNYDVYYRVHSQTFGWLDWAKNGEVAGTEGLSKRLEAIEIKLVEKGTKAPGPTARPSLTKPSVLYSTHVQTYGWMDSVSDGAISGTTGKAKRLEAIKIDLKDAPYSGGITYSTHVQSKGWLKNVSNGAASGTSGESKRLEAIKINLTGEMAKHYDVYYRVHAQNFGWLGWAKNGMEAGSQGLSKRLEAIEVKLVSKGKGQSVNKEDAFKKIGTVEQYTDYPINFSDMIDRQMAASPKADGAGLLYASRKFVEYYANPNNISKDSSSYLQFLNLSKTAGLSVTELYNKVLIGKGIFSGKAQAQAFINAGKKYNINEVYLISHALHETGNGSSILSNGTIQVGEISKNKWVSIQPKGAYIAECKVTKSGACKWKITKDKKFNIKNAKNIKTTYNAFGIGALDQNPNVLGSVRAYQEGWFKVEDAIIGGAQFISKGYIDRGQNTLYKMRWNPDNPATHQYATHVAWAESQTIGMANIYQLLESYVLHFDVPKFKNQPSASPKPTGDAQYALDRKLEGKSAVTTSNLNFRTGPKTTNSIIRTIPKNTKVTIIGQNGGWYKVKVDGKAGWVSGDYIVVK